MTDKEIIKGCGKGNKVAQESLYTLFANRMMGLCRRYSQNREEAEDIFQDGFVKVFGGISKLSSSEKLEPWLKRVFVNTAITYYHKNKKHHNHFDSEELDLSQSHALDAIEHLSQQELLVFVNELPEGYRMVFNLYVMEGFKHNEIAKVLDISTGTSKSQLSKAKAMLKKKLAQVGINQVGQK
ncbi:MAG: RNA polymerase sigma factor (sigma-70 family) [Arenicella sp.]|jgi:RNA polymerase sigma factor (sigma-70 family)